MLLFYSCLGVGNDDHHAITPQLHMHGGMHTFVCYACLSLASHPGCWQMELQINESRGQGRLEGMLESRARPRLGQGLAAWLAGRI